METEISSSRTWLGDDKERKKATNYYPRTSLVKEEVIVEEEEVKIGGREDNWNSSTDILN